jgi:hypothetical protein
MHIWGAGFAVQDSKGNEKRKRVPARADEKGFNLAVFQHLIDAFPLEASIHVWIVPTGVQQKLMMTTVKGLHID